MVAPPGPLSATSASALSKLTLKKTPAGIAVFMIKFPSALGPLLASTLRSAMKGTLNKEDTRAIKLLEIIYDCLVGCMPDDNDVVKMTNDCGMDGHLCLLWLKRKYPFAHALLCYVCFVHTTPLCVQRPALQH